MFANSDNKYTACYKNKYVVFKFILVVFSQKKKKRKVDSKNLVE